MHLIMAAYYPNNNVTTHHIQQYLDENKSLILKIVESQNSGKLSECAENQARLQRNLMYLASIADSQPQPPNINSQYPGGGNYLQQQQQIASQSLMATRSSMMYGAQPYPSLQQQAMHDMLSSSGGLMLQGEPLTGFSDFGSKQDNVQGRGGSAGLYLKSSEDGN